MYMYICIYIHIVFVCVCVCIINIVITILMMNSIIVLVGDIKITPKPLSLLQHCQQSDRHIHMTITAHCNQSPSSSSSSLVHQQRNANKYPNLHLLSGGCGVIWFVLWMVLVYDTPQTHPTLGERERSLFHREGMSVQKGNNRVVCCQTNSEVDLESCEGAYSRCSCLQPIIALYFI